MDRSDDVSAPRQEMKRDPDAVTGELGKVLVVEHAMRGGGSAIEGAGLETAQTVVGGVVHVLCCAGDDLGFLNVEAGAACGDEGDRVVKVDVHRCGQGAGALDRREGSGVTAR
jgi:hypothetical protein